MDITEFSDYFESYRAKIVQELKKDYEGIGDLYLKSIEESTVKSTAEKWKPSEEMRPYYMYWERRIFNAITKMIVKALATNKTIFTRTQKPYLIKMAASYNGSGDQKTGITFHPSPDELRTQFSRFSENILASSK